MKGMYKRLLVLLITAMLLVTVFATGAYAAETEEPERRCYLHGDVDGDGGITPDDAIYALYHNFNENRYPIDQSCDFDGDGMVTADDAIYLSRANFNESLLQGLIHDWFDPAWTWAQTPEGYSATVTLKCACGDPIVYIDEVKVAEDESAYRAPNCVTPGQRVYVATVTDADGNVLVTDTYTVELPTGGHVLVSGGCEDPICCENCDYKQEAKGHEMKAQGEATTGTCQVKSVQTYKCENCPYTEEVELGLGPCTYTLYEPRLQDGRATCYWLKQYKCSGCGNVIDGTADDDKYTIHTYTAELKESATCSKTGMKVYTCSQCNDSYEEVVDIIADAHIWDSGVTVDGVTTYTCAGCGTTKTSVAATNGAAVDTSALAENELELDAGVTMALDSTAAESLDAEKAVIVSVEPVDVSIVNLDNDKKEQIAGSTVYDLSMVYADTNEKVSDFNGGSVTITLPYELGEGEDIDSIDIWYIGDNGELERCDGVYANGYVTFTTTHFSYYTVTRLTPAERCERYGHIIVSTAKLPTCTEDGYSMEYCQRCGVQQKNEVAEMKGHSYEVVEAESKAATCLEKGEKVEKCATCGHERTSEVPALGHKLETKTTEAECEKTGLEVVTCLNGCDYHTEKLLPALGHSFQDTETVDPDCTTHGHKKQTCTRCGKKQEKDKTLPTGHDYSPENAVWKWNANHTSAEVTLVCAYDPKHTKTLKAVVTENAEAAGCTSSGSVIYTATASFNNMIYTDAYSEEVGAVGHTPGEGWDSNKYYHYKVCEVCGESFDEAAHKFGEITITKAPTCNQVGSGVEVCDVCGYESTVVLPATGEHTFVDGVCSSCGFDENACSHIAIRNKTPIDLSGYDLCEGTELYFESCDCGESVTLRSKTIGCQNMEYLAGGEVKEVALPDGTVRELFMEDLYCSDCGLTIKSAYYIHVLPDTCAGYNATYYEYVLDGEVIVKGTEFHGDYLVAHPRYIVKNIELSEYGLCGGILSVTECRCGESAFVSFERWDEEGNSYCNWVYNEETGRETCSVCGVSFMTTWEMENGECFMKDIGIWRFYDAQGNLLLLEQKMGMLYDFHMYQYTDYKMYGDSCTDGVIYIMACETCGKLRETYGTEHRNAYPQVTDLTGKNFCADAIVTNVCPCGYVQYAEERFPNGSHSFTEREDGSSYCENCHYTMVLTEEFTPKTPGNCEQLRTRTKTYTNESGDVIRVVNKDITLNHDYEYEIIMNGDSCDDGFVRRSHCTHCDETYDSNYYSHQSFEDGERVDISALGACSAYITYSSCPCGLETYESHTGENGSCDFYSYENEDGEWVRYCGYCDLHITEKVTEVAVIDDCHVRNRYTYTYTRGDAEPLVHAFEKVDLTHSYEIDAVLMDENGTCDNGVYITHTCKLCGYDYKETYYHHYTYSVHTEEYVAEGMCGPITVTDYRCACGRDTGTSLGMMCNFNEGYYDEKLDIRVDRCSDCGVIRANRSLYRKAESDNPCQYDYVHRHEFFTKDYEKILDYDYVGTSVRHNYDFTFTMEGTSCEEGYYAYAQCVDCGEVYTDGTYLYTGHDTWQLMEKCVFPGSEDTCGAVFFERSGCACGMESGYYLSSSCNFQYEGYDNETNQEIYVCTICGLERRTKYLWNQKPGSCEAEAHIEIILTLNGEQLAAETFEYSYRDHMNVTVFNLLGETCEDGYTYYDQCVYCGATGHTSEVNYSHDVRMIDCRDLADYGMCAGEVHINSCACGQEANVGYNYTCGEYTDKVDPETGMSERYCEVCGNYSYYAWDQSYDVPNCRATSTLKIKLADGNGAVLLDESFSGSWDSHTLVYGLNGTCGDGNTYTYTGECYYCDYTEVCDAMLNGHGTWLTDYLELKDIGSECGGVIRVNKCACGENGSVEFVGGNHRFKTSYSEEVDENGISHLLNSEVCLLCGLEIRKDQYEETVDACHRKEHITNTYRLGDWEKTVEVDDIWESHNMQVTRSGLEEGSVSCEDGIWFYQVCQDCGWEELYSGSDHYMVNATEQIDLAQYGAICGSTLTRYACACGENWRYDVTGECDIDRQNTSNFVDGAVIGEWQHTTEGYRGIYSNAYILACAVTDPDSCGLVIRMSEYWLREGCLAVEYQTWQLGYDRENNTWEREITFPTGDSHALHDYVISEISETNDDGTTVSGNWYDCADCGSYYYDKYTYDNGDRIRHERYAYNDPALDNGENRSLMEVQEYDFFYKGYRYETLSRQETVYADGSAHWYQNVYTDYNFDGTCTRTRHYSNIYGDESYTYNESAHMSVGQEDWDKMPTCTQFGQIHYRDWCPVCESVFNESYYERDPYDHDWHYDDGIEQYRCWNCGLENQNGASGTIVMEDLTDSYGNGEDYVIGYWNRKDLQFMPTVSLVLYDSDLEENQLYLQDITVSDFRYLSVEKDGITGIAIDCETVLTAADAAIAEADYAGRYAVRINFVPVNGGDTLDYAVTFDAIYTAEQPEAA